MKYDEIYLFDDVRIYQVNKSIRFRKGVWSFFEIALNLDDYDEAIKLVLQSIIKALKIKKYVDLRNEKGISQLSLESTDRLEYFLLELLRMNFLSVSKNISHTDILTALYGSNAPADLTSSPALFISDNEISKTAITNIANQMSFSLDLLDELAFQELTRIQLSCTESVRNMQLLEEYKFAFEKYACLLCVMSILDVNVLRNLNRIAIHVKKPVVLGYIDGQFVNWVSIVPNETGCLECLEKSSISKIQDHTLYNEFVNQMDISDTHSRSNKFSPYLNMLVSQVVTEGYFYSLNVNSRLKGQILSIYTPVFEINIQEIHRLPECPACGFSIQSNIQDLYVESDLLIQQLLHNVPDNRFQELVDEL